ncbi:serine/threonine protein phosphatase [Candidimonas nitroreducens]|uniref:Serine/threonine protein phosphatase n=2 Tax=Candidimonas nitroreducens TaxID=683354 RepID=A0A225MLT0_9BURK|nr:serine/threonine protein phosphatase [Candidimonas nitroreducens]
MQIIQYFERNNWGRDFAVGDIHGHFTRLQKALDDAGFDPLTDRLFSVGDLVDRGPECQSVLEWLAKPWFHPVQGNHEDIAIRCARGNPIDEGIYSRNGGDWFMAMDYRHRQEFGAAFEALPTAIEVETRQGLIGIVHADCPVADWSDLETELLLNRVARDRAMWSRGRIESEDRTGVSGIRAVVVGHTPLRRPAVLGNVWHIDTGGWLPDGSGHFTLLNLDSLEAIPPVAPKLQWESA